jgi:hypothetical protein
MFFNASSSRASQMASSRSAGETAEEVLDAMAISPSVALARSSGGPPKAEDLAWAEGL